MEKEIAPDELASLMAAHEQQFKERLEGKVLEALFAYTFQSRPVDELNEHALLAFGGLDMVVDGMPISMGFNIEMELLDIKFGEFAKLNGQAPLNMLPQDQVSMFNELEGRKILSSSFKWIHYFELNEDFEPVEEPSFAPIELILKFEGEKILHLAGLHFQLRPDGELINPTYHPEGALLISRYIWEDIASEG